MSPLHRSLVLAPVVASLSLSACAPRETWLQLPEPTGAHEVGVTTATLVDVDRAERFGKGESPRVLTVTTWYPAEPTGQEEPAPALLDLGADDVRAGIKAMGLPGSVADALEATDTAAWLDAPVSQAETTWPVLLFSHGFLAVPEFYSGAAAELASHGYVVVSINHPYEAAATVTDYGEVIEGKLARFMFRIVPQMLGVPAMAELEAGPEKAERTERLLEKNTLLGESIEEWVADSAFVLDELERDGLAPLAGRLDLDRVGALGHSFGGATAVALAMDDPRIDAAINWDGFQFGDVYGREVPVPTLMIESEQIPAANEMILGDTETVDTILFEGILHLGISDLAYVGGLSDRDLEKKIGTDAAEAMDAIVRVSLDHMDAHVGGAGEE